MINEEKETSVEYWRSREEALNEKELNKDENFEKELLKEYKKYQKEIKAEINQYYKEFAESTGMTIAQAKKYLSSTQLDNFVSKMDVAITEMEKNGVDPAIINKYKSYNERLKISRLDAILTEINAQTDILSGKIEQMSEKYLKDSIQRTFWEKVYQLETGTGLNMGFTGLDQRLIENILYMKWVQDKNWLISFKEENLKLKGFVYEIIAQGTALGLTEAEMIDKLMAKIALSYARAQVNIRTNKNFMENQSFKEAYKQAGFQKYTFIAMHPRGQHPHWQCTKLDGQTFNLKDAVVGANYPPISYNCRSTTAVNLDQEQLNNLKDQSKTRVDKNLSYAEFMKKYYPKQYTKLLKEGAL